MELEKQIDRLSSLLQKLAKGKWDRSGFDLALTDARAKARSGGREADYGIHAMKSLRKGVLHMLAFENNAPALLPDRQAVRVRSLMGDGDYDLAADCILKPADAGLTESDLKLPPTARKLLQYLKVHSPAATSKVLMLLFDDKQRDKRVINKLDQHIRKLNQGPSDYIASRPRGEDVVTLQDFTDH